MLREVVKVEGGGAIIEDTGKRRCGRVQVGGG